MSTSSDSDASDEYCKICPNEVCPGGVVIYFRLLKPGDTSPQWSSDIILQSCDEYSTEIRIQFVHAEKKTFFYVISKFLQKLWKCTKLRANVYLRMHYEKKCDRRFTEIIHKVCAFHQISIHHSKKKSFYEVQRITLDFLRSLVKIKPSLFIIKKAFCGPVETDFGFLQFALEQSIKITLFTKVPPSIEYFRLVVEVFLSGRPMTRGHFLWMRQKKCFDFTQVLEGADIIYKGTQFNRIRQPVRNYFHLKHSVEDPPVLSLAATACFTDPCDCTESNYHFTFRWDLTN